MRQDPEALAAELAAVEEELAEARVIRLHVARNPDRFSVAEREAAFERADQLAARCGQLSALVEAASGIEAVLLAERHRLARDLHDGPLQALSNLVLETEILERLLERDPERVPAELGQFKDTVRAVVADVRRHVAAMGPAALETEDLVPALRRLAAEWQEGTGTECKLKVAGQDRELPPAVQQTLYWIASEALNNVRSHAEAGRVAIEVDIRGESAGIRIRDDGKGFDVTSVMPGGDPPRLGLLGMRERALAAGGVLEVRSRPGSGTLVEAEIPIA